DPRVSASDLDPGLVSVVGALLLAGQVPLGLLQALLAPAQEAGAVDLRAVGEDREVPGPRSIPTSGVVCGSSSSGPVSTTKLAKYRPALSLTTVTVDGMEGSERDHLT